MARTKPWLKLWVEWVDDVKMLALTLAEQGAWWRLCTLAQKCAADGLLVKANGTPLSLDEILDAIRIKPADRKVFGSMVEKMTDQGSLHWESKTLVITNFAERQAKTTSETPQAVAERVRRYRERKLVTGNPLHEERERSKEKESPPLPGEEEAEAEAEGNGKNSVTVTEMPLHSSLPLAKIAILHEQFFGIITPVLAEKFKDFVEKYRGPVEWIDLAFAEAVKLKNRRWPYVEAILNSWQEKGGPHADRRERGDEGQGPGANPQASGWTDVGDEQPPEAAN